MKRFLSLFIALILVLSVFAGCEKVENDGSSISSKPVVELVTLASKGKIPEMQFGIGDKVEDVTAYYDQQFESDPYASEVVVYEVKEYTKIDLGSYAYYYKTEDKEAGIVGVTAVDKAFGFSMGSMSTIEDVKAASPDDAVETIVTHDDLFFLLGADPEGAKKIYINTGEYELKLIFFNGYLSAVSLFD